MYTVPSPDPDPNPKEGSQLPNPKRAFYANECNEGRDAKPITLTIWLLDGRHGSYTVGTAYEFATRRDGVGDRTVISLLF